ncbi:MAG TPA: hypothetical protein VGM69_14280 [Chloroflexota bacterium]
MAARMKAALAGARIALADLEAYGRLVVGRPLRPYQLEPGLAISRAVLGQRGGTYSVQMARQAGKNELSAQLEGYLLTLCGRHGGGSIVKAAPTFEPQLVISKLRLREVMANRLDEIAGPRGLEGYVLESGRARIFFLSAGPAASVVGATASLLLEVDEAQDVDPEKHDRDFAPMAASTNAPRVYYGVAGTADSLIERVKEQNLELERRDGLRRHFAYPWWVVAEHNPAYGAFVEAERDRLGAAHPIFRTQYELRALASEDALFDEAALRALQGDHPRREAPEPGRTYVAGVDVAGPAELVADPYAGGSRRGRPDSTVVTIAENDPDGWSEHAPCAPDASPLRVVRHLAWTGRSHVEQHEELVRLLGEEWRCQAIAFDATGLGQAPCELLRRRLGERVRPVTFTGPKKSELGYALLAAVNGRRVALYRAGPDDDEARACWAQLRACRRYVQGRMQMGWEARRGHDDYVTSLALCLHAARFAQPYLPGVLFQRPLDFAEGRF